MEFNEQMLEYIKEINKFLDDAIIIEDVPEGRLLESMKYSLMARWKEA